MNNILSTLQNRITVFKVTFTIKKQKTISEFPLNIKARRTAVAAPSVSRTDILFKQAESYRLANYWQQAASSYKQCMEKDPSEYSSALYWYAVCERSLG